MNNDPIGDFLQAVETAAVHEADVYAEDAVLDPTVRPPAPARAPRARS